MTKDRYSINVIFSRFKKYEGRQITIAKKRWFRSISKINKYFVAMLDDESGFRFYMQSADEQTIVLVLLVKNV